MQLAELQRLFWDACRGEVAEPRLQQAFKASPSMGAVERTRVYAGMYVARHVLGLADSFPKLHTLLGEEGFSRLATHYLAAQPSRHPALERHGARLASFLKESDHPQAALLASIAALEWARCECFLSPHTAPLREVTLDATSLPDARPTLSPSLRLVTVLRGALIGWSALHEGDRPSLHALALADAPVPVAVWRGDFRVSHRALSSEEHTAVLRGFSREPFSRLISAFGESADAADVAGRCLAGWLNDGWFLELR